MIKIKTVDEIQIMTEGGQMAGRVLKEALDLVKPGLTTLELDAYVEKRITSFGARPSFLDFEGYGFATCINVNDGIVHGLPGKYIIANGDLVSIDLGVFYKGFHTDISWTVIAGKGSPEKEKFLAAGRLALEKSIDQCREGNRVGDISYAMQSVVEKSGYQVVRDLVGHGIGRDLHEEPQVPCYGRAGSGIILTSGLVLAVEVIYTQGSPKLIVLPDGWTMATKDGRLSGLFEQTVAIVGTGPKILTAG